MQTFKSLTIITLASLMACGNGGSESQPKTETPVEVSDEGGVPAITDYAKTLPLDKIKLPAGFKIDVFAEVPDARSLAISPSGTVFVGNRDKDKVYAVKDTDGDFKADKK